MIAIGLVAVMFLRVLYVLSQNINLTGLLKSDSMDSKT
jgi:hypothetical protein